jgi:hypothetical protein
MKVLGLMCSACHDAVSPKNVGRNIFELVGLKDLGMIAGHLLM